MNGPAEPTLTAVIGGERYPLAISRGSLGPGRLRSVNVHMDKGEGDLAHKCQQRNQEIAWMPPEELHNLPRYMV